jgi:hypothetical protein
MIIMDEAKDIDIETLNKIIKVKAEGKLILRSTPLGDSYLYKLWRELEE